MLEGMVRILTGACAGRLGPELCDTSEFQFAGSLWQRLGSVVTDHHPPPTDFAGLLGVLIGMREYPKQLGPAAAGVREAEISDGHKLRTLSILSWLRVGNWARSPFCRGYR